MKNKVIILLINYVFLTLFSSASAQDIYPANVGSLVEQDLGLMLKSILSTRLSSEVEQNTLLKTCVWLVKRGEKDCLATDAQQIYPLVFFTEDGLPISGMLNGELTKVNKNLLLIENTTGLNGKMSLLRKPCIDSNPGKCEIRIYVGFRARCLGGKKVCDQAEYIDYYYTVNTQEKVEGIFVTKTLSNIEQNKPISIKVSDVLKLGMNSCPYYYQQQFGYKPYSLRTRCFLSLNDITKACNSNKIVTKYGFIGKKHDCKINKQTSCQDLCPSLAKINIENKCNNTIDNFDLSFPGFYKCKDNIYVKDYLIYAKNNPAEIKCATSEVILGKLPQIDCAYKIGKKCLGYNMTNFSCGKKGGGYWEVSPLPYR